MAAKQEKFTLTLDFNVERGKLQEIGNMFGKDLEKGLRGTKTLDYFSNLKSSVGDFSKVVNGLYSDLSKPLVSKSQAKELASNLELAFKGLDNKLLSLQGNIGKTFSSTSNVEALKQIRQLGDELDKLTEDYQAVSQLFNKSRSLGNKGELKSQLSSASKQYDILSKKQTALTAEEKKQQTDLKKTIDSINVALAEKARLSEQINGIQASHGVHSQAEFSNLISNKVDEQNNLINGSISVKDAQTLKDILTQLRNIIKDIYSTSNATAPKIVENIEGIELQRKEAEEQAKTFKSVMKELGIPMLSLQEIASGLKRVMSYSYEYIKNLDKALTEISVVSGKTRDEVQQLTSTFIELSAKTGMAIDQIAQASTIFYQQGLGDAAVKQLTEYTALFAKISGEDVSTAANQITAAINGFGFAYTEVENVVDKMSVLAAHSAADIGELATAMSKGASQAAMAGLSFDQYNAYLATMIETTREAPENLGTSLKTIMSRFLSIKSGENTEDDTDINAVETALKSVGVQLRDSQGQLRELGDVLNDLGPKWEGLDRNTQAYLGTVIAGTRQQSRFISLMQNWDRALELTADSERSAGAATKMHQAAMEGLDASINNLTNAWQELISSILDSDFFKTIINGLTGFIKYFSEGNSVLKIITSAIILVNAKTIMTNLNLIKQNETIKNANTIWGTFKNAISNVKTQFHDLSTPMSAATQEIARQTAELEKHTAALNNDAQAQAAHNGTAAPGTPGVVPGVNGNNTPPVEVPVNIDEKALENISKKTGFKGTIEKLKGKFTTLGANVTKLMGTFQTAALGFSIGVQIGNVATSIISDLKPFGEKLVQKAEEEYNSYQKEKEAQAEIVNTIRDNIDVYETLSRKVGKTTEDLEKMGQAADAIAKVMPSLVNGYDINGNPIINPREARNAQDKAEQQLASKSVDQMKSIGEAAVGELQTKAQEEVEKTTNLIKTGALVTGTAVGAAAGAKIGAAIGTAAAPGIGTAIGAGIGALVGVIGGFLAGEAVEDAKYNDMLKDFSDVFNEERVSQMYENIANINQAVVSDKEIDGVTSKQRSSVVSYMGQSYMDSKITEASNLIREGKKDEGIKVIEESGTEYSALFGNGTGQINERELAKIYRRIQVLISDASDLTFEEMNEKLGHLLVEVGIEPDNKAYELLKEGLGNAAYSGISSGLFKAIKDIKVELAKVGTTRTMEDGSTSSEAADIFGKLNTKQMSFYYNQGLFADADVFSDILENNNQYVLDALEVSETNGQLALVAILEQYKEGWEEAKEDFADDLDFNSWDEIDYDILPPEVQEKYDEILDKSNRIKNALDEVYASMDSSAGMTWGQLADGIDQATQKLQTMQNILDDMADNGRITWENFTKLASVLDGIDYSSLSTEQLERFNEILDNLSSGWQVVNGEITINEQGIKSLADMQAYLAEVELEGMRNKLRTRKAELEVNQTVLEAEKASLIYKLESLGEDVDATITADEAKAKADAAWVAASTKATDLYTTAQAEAAKSVLGSYTSAFAGIADVWNKLMTAMTNNEQVDIARINEVANTVKNNIKKQFNTDEYLKKAEEAGALEGLDKNEQIDYYKKKLAGVNKEIENNRTAIHNVDAQLRVLDNSAGSLGKLASGTAKQSNKDAEEYIGKLKEIYNILRRIEMLEHRLSTLDSYAEMVPGKDYGSLLQSRLGYATELVEQYKFLTTEQKKFENGYRKFIESRDEVKGVFKFDDAGQIIINWDKYTQLSGKNLEIADELYDTYQKLHQETMDNYTSLIKAKQKEIELNQEIVDSYIDIEKQAADAIKEIYKKILDDKLEAIEKEKQALEDLREARERANEDIKNAKEVSGLQTNLQRAMMDTSGASDVNLIKAQQDLDDKLDAIAEDKYSQMLEDLQDKLDAEKEALQDNFDQLFENLQWLYEMIDADLMTNPDSLSNVLQQTNDWAMQSDAARNLTINEWEKKISTYTSALAKGGDNTIEKIIEATRLTKAEIATLENTLKTKQTKDGQDIVSSLNSIKGIVSKYNGGGGNGGSSYTPNASNFPSGSAPKVTDNGKAPAINPDKPKAVSSYAIGDTLSTKEGGWLDVVSQYNLKNGKMEKDWGVIGARAQNKEVTDIKYYDGQFYYLLKGLDGYIKGKQLDRKKKGGGTHLEIYGTGGLNTYTGPAWLDGTPQKPEAVLNALQTEHFIKFTNVLDKLMGGSNATPVSNSSINIDNIQFHVDSMSSAEDGEKAFNMFVDKFKEIGNRSGIKVTSFKNDL